MAKGQLPRAYLRMDPNLDQTHPDPGAFVKLLCAGARQPKRGRFRDLKVLEAAIGRKAAKVALDRRDIVAEGDRLVIDGWDIWQEGDYTVGERMRRFRERHDRYIGVSSGVTDTVTKPSPPSEASGVKAIETETDNGSAAAPATAPPPLRLTPPSEPKPAKRGGWTSEACDDWNARYGAGSAPGGKIAGGLSPLVKAQGWERVRPAWRRYLAETTHPSPSAQDFASHFGDWRTRGQPEPERQRPSDIERVVAEAPKLVAAFVEWRRANPMPTHLGTAFTHWREGRGISLEAAAAAQLLRRADETLRASA